MKQSQIIKRYGREFTLSMIAYMAMLIGSVYTIQNIPMIQPVKIIVAVLPAVPVVFVLIAVMHLLADSDELQQRMHLLAITCSAVLTGFITFTYGFLENLGFPPFPTIWILPMMFALWGLGLGYFSRRYQ
jgi:hypothetical protein